MTSKTIFTPPNRLYLAERVMAELPGCLGKASRQTAGVTRKQLFQDDEHRLVWAYDPLANGKSETWVSDRTMSRRYKRMARTTKEANLGELIPMIDAIPELTEAR